MTTDGKKPVPDLLRPGIDLLFVGINPGRISAREGHHFANPANGFWRLMHQAGFTSRKLLPTEERLLLREGIGLTNLVSRETRGVAQLTRPDLEKGRTSLARTIRRYHPRAVVFVGITAFRAFVRTNRPVICGEQSEPVEGARVFVVPNPSGRNAHFSYAQMLEIYRKVAREIVKR